MISFMKMTFIQIVTIYMFSGLLVLDLVDIIVREENTKQKKLNEHKYKVSLYKTMSCLVEFSAPNDRDIT